MYSNVQGNDQRLAVTSKVQNLHNGSTEPTDTSSENKLAGISRLRIQKRKQWIQNGVQWCMTPEQIELYTFIMGDRVAARQVRNYIAEMKVTKRQQHKMAKQTFHDEHVFNAFLKIGVQLTLAGFPPSAVQFNQSPGEGARFCYDFKFIANGHLFFGEVQLSDLVSTDWRSKHRKYVRFRKSSDIPFRVLWIIDQDDHLGLLLYNARQSQKDYPNLNIHFYMSMRNLKHSENVITKEVWKNVNGKACIAIDLA